MRNLNMFLGMEVVNGRINGSASDVEKNSRYKNSYHNYNSNNYT